MTFETKKEHVYAMGSSLHLLDVMFTDDMNRRVLQLDEWQEYRGRMAQPANPIPRMEAAVTLHHGAEAVPVAPDDDIDIDTEMALLFGIDEVPEVAPPALDTPDMDAFERSLEADFKASMAAGTLGFVPMFPSRMDDTVGDDDGRA